MILKYQIKNESPRLIRRKDVQLKTGLGASSIYAMMECGRFPKPIKLSERRVAWIESDVDLWISERIAGHQVATVNTLEGADK